MIKKDCFAYNYAHHNCKALKIIDCENCRFYKTEEQLLKELQLIKKRKN